VSLTASASDSDGTVSAVEYRIGSGTGPLIGRSTTAPYPVWWTNMSAGSYTVIAIAFDDRNGTRTSAPVHITIQANRPPTVALTAPVASATYTAPANIVVAASANDSDGSIAKVEFYAGSTLIGSSTTAPYTVAWNAVDAGAFLVTAKATDNLGLVAASSAVPVTVVNNAPPTVALAAPSPGGPYFAPATITLTATASDGDGSIARVDFQADGMLIGSATATPYSIIWDNVADGSHSVTARAVDDRGGVTVTDPLSVTVNADATILPFAGLDGSTVDDDSAVVGGTITAPPNSGVLVNGVLAQLEANGRFHANGVPLIPGTNAITIKVVSQDGQVATKAITMSSNGPAPFAVLATPTEGLAPLQVTYQIENRADRAFQRLAFDYNDDGIVDFTATASQFVDGVFTLIVTYPAGTVTTRLTVYDVDNAVIQSTARVITARTVEQQDALIKGVYDAMLERLRAGKIAMALNAISGDMQDKYGAVFTGLGANLIDEVNGLGTLQPNWYSSDHAEYFLTRDTPEGQQAFLIDFIRGQDGIWRIHAM
jgi:hypothetical protein